MTNGVGTADDPWTLTSTDHVLVMSKRGETRLGFAILLSFFRNHGRFPRQESEVDPQGIATLSRQLNVPTSVDGEAFLTCRTAERIRSEIRVRFGFREATVADADALEAGGEIAAVVERLEARCRELSIEPPTVERMERIARSAVHAHEERFHADIYARLSPTIRERLDDLLGYVEVIDVPNSAPAPLLRLRGNPGSPSLASMQEELATLELIRGIDLPIGLFDHASARDLERCRQRVTVEAPHELRRHPDAARITWLAAFVHLRARSLTDDLVDVLIRRSIGSGRAPSARSNGSCSLTSSASAASTICYSNWPMPPWRSRMAWYATWSFRWSMNRRCALWSRKGRPRDPDTGPRCAP